MDKQTSLKMRKGRKIYRRWVSIPEKQTPWKKPTIDKIITYWLHTRFVPDNVAESAW